MRILDCADSAVLVELDGVGDPVAIAEDLRHAAPEGTGACIAGLDSVLVEYDCLTTDGRTLRSRIAGIVTGHAGAAPPSPRHMALPVCFAEEVAPDLGEVAQRSGLTPEEVIRCLTGAELRVAMVGHLPGLPYLTGLPATLDLPRRPCPRTRVAAGSVGVAAAMACVYPSAAPGGWHLVGRTPATLWDAEADPPTLLRAGDLVTLVAVSIAALRPDNASLYKAGG